MGMEEQIKSQESFLKQLFELSGTPGLSVGVVQNGKTVYTAHFGQRVVGQPDPPNDDTLYSIISLTKLVTAGVVASLFYDGILHWDRPIREYLPEFHRHDEVGLNVNLLDLLSNRSGLSSQTTFWGFMKNEYLLDKTDIVPMSCEVDAVSPFRKDFVYSNWNYGLITAAVEKVNGQLFSVCAQERIFGPLGMTRSTTKFPNVENVAALHALTPTEKPTILNWHPGWTDETGFAAGGAARSSVKELLLLYDCILRTYRHQSAESLDATPGSPFRYMRKILSPHIAVMQKFDIGKLGYCLGTYRSVLPANLSVGNINNVLLGKKNRYVFGQNATGVEIFHQNGARPGAFAAAHLIPSANSAVSAMANSLPLFDVTDFVVQHLTAVILGEEKIPDYLELAKMAVMTNTALYGYISKLLNSGKSDKPPSCPLENFEGRYYNPGGSKFFFTVRTLPGQKLELTCMDRPLTRYVLEHYNSNSFYWPPDRSQESLDAVWPFLPPQSRIFTFHVDNSDRVGSFENHHDFSSSKPGIFVKTGEKLARTSLI